MVIGRGPALRASSHWHAVSAVAAKGLMKASPRGDHASPVQPTPTSGDAAARGGNCGRRAERAGWWRRAAEGRWLGHVIAYGWPPACVAMPLPARRRRNSLSVGVLCSRGIGWATLVECVLR